MSVRFLSVSRCRVDQDARTELLEGAIGKTPMQSPRVPFGRNAFRNVGYRTVDAGLLKSSLIQETMRLQFPAEAFNLFNFRNVAFVSAYDYLNNPAFIYGWGILRNFQTAAPDSGYMRQRTASSGYDSSTMRQ